MNIQKQFKISSIIILVLGFIHTCATPLILYMLCYLKKSDLLTFAFMFVCTGLSLIFVGWLQLFVVKHSFLENKGKHILKVSTWFMLITGFLAIITMYNNPFAYIILLIALYELVLLKPMLKINTADETIS